MLAGSAGVAAIACTWRLMSAIHPTCTRLAQNWSRVSRSTRAADPVASQVSASQRRGPIGPPCLALVGARDPEQHCLRERPADELKADRQPASREPGRHRKTGQPKIVDRPRAVVEAAEHLVHVLAVADVDLGQLRYRKAQHGQ